METGTFLQEEVKEYINKNFLPLKYESGADAEQFRRFAVRATPSYVILDPGGNEISRIVGFYNAKEFIDQLEIARREKGGS